MQVRYGGIAWLMALALLAGRAAGAERATPGPAAADEPALNVGFLVLEGVYNSELAAPFDIFHHTVFHVKPGMRVFTVGRSKGMVTSFEGLRIGVDHDLESAPRIDVLVVPSAEHNMDSDLEDRRLIDWVGRRGRAARHVVSICDGAFVLAEAGLLDGRRCTTFPGDIAAFRKRFPRLTVVEGVRFVADGPAITGVGGARSYDPAMYLVERVYGTEVAEGVSRGMVLGWDREKIRHLAIDGDAARLRCYLPGDRVDGRTRVLSASEQPVTLEQIAASRPDVKAIVLTIIAGASAYMDDPVRARAAGTRGGFWCEDSFSEIPNLRYLHMQYADRGVLFVAVMCPPVHHETQMGYDQGSFVHGTGGDEVRRRNRRRFIEGTEQLVREADLPFDTVVYDPGFTLLGSTGRFKWFQDTQMYGTPTTWVLTGDLEVPGPPFYMNVYESEGRKLRYQADDVAELLERVLGRPAPSGEQATPG